MINRVLPLWGIPLRYMAAGSVAAYVKSAYRIRGWGSLPRKRGPTLIVSNHQIDLDLMEVIAILALSGGEKSPLLAASARLLHEPGFMAIRIPWLWRAFHNVNLGWLFMSLGLLPLENQLQTRSAARWAWSVERLHGVKALREVFKPAVLERLGYEHLTTADLFTPRYFHLAQQTSVRMSELQVEYRREQFDLTKQFVETDLKRIADALHKGATFYITPEGEYPLDGRMLPFRGIWEHLEPHAPLILLAAISYDPLMGRRLSQLYRIVPLRDRANVVNELKAARPVTVSALLCEWLHKQSRPFSEETAVRAVCERLANLPAGLFVDPEFLASPAPHVRQAIAHAKRLGVLRDTGEALALSEERRHPRFAKVRDIVAYQAVFFEETLDGLQACTGSFDPENASRTG